jgi:hypothetical protein
MKKTLALACFVVLAFPLIAAADGLNADEMKVYNEAAADTNPAYGIPDSFKAALAKYGDPTKCKDDQCAGWRQFLASYKLSKPQVNSDATKKAINKIAQSCGNNQTFDGTKCVDTNPIINPSSSNSNSNSNTNSGNNPTGPSDNSALNDNTSAVPNLSAQTTTGDTPNVAPANDPNKWNSTIAGAKMGIWAGMIAFILGGPAGMLLWAMVGFGAGYIMNKLGD